MKALLFIESGINPDLGRLAPLLEATRNNMMTIVESLVNFGADLKATDNTGQNSLHIAIMNYKADLRIVRYLLDAGVFLDHVDYNEQSPLFFAVWTCAQDVVDCLLNAGANVNSSDIYGRTPLLIATSHTLKNTNDDTANLRFFAIVKTLLKYGAEPDIGTIYHDTPLWEAVNDDNLQLVKLFVRYNASMETKCRGQMASVDLQTDRNNPYVKYVRDLSPMINCVKLGHVQMALWMLEAGYDVYSEDWIKHIKSTGNMDDGTALLSLLNDLSTRLPSLLWACRKSLRKGFATNLLVYLKSRDIPKAIVNYILFKNIKPYQVKFNDRMIDLSS